MSMASEGASCRAAGPWHFLDGMQPDGHGERRRRGPAVVLGFVRVYAWMFDAAG